MFDAYKIRKDFPMLVEKREKPYGVIQYVIPEFRISQDMIDKDFKLCNHEYANGYCYGLQYDLAKILDQIQGETNGSK